MKKIILAFVLISISLGVFSQTVKTQQQLIDYIENDSMWQYNSEESKYQIVTVKMEQWMKDMAVSAMFLSEALDADSLIDVKLDSLATVLRAEMGAGIVHDTINNNLIATSGTVIDTFYSDGTASASPLYGPELVPTPDFSSATGFDLSNGTTITGGECVANTAATYATLFSLNPASVSAANFQNGTTYEIRIDVTEYTSGTFRVRLGNTSVILGYTPEVTTYTEQITTTEVPTSVLIGNMAGGAVMKFDNFSIKEVL
jgi:hypothetical protein